MVFICQQECHHRHRRHHRHRQFSHRYRNLLVVVAVVASVALLVAVVVAVVEVVKAVVAVARRLKLMMLMVFVLYRVQEIWVLITCIFVQRCVDLTILNVRTAKAKMGRMIGLSGFAHQALLRGVSKSVQMPYICFGRVDIHNGRSISSDGQILPVFTYYDKD